jgi:hypothetical protein
MTIDIYLWPVQYYLKTQHVSVPTGTAQRASFVYPSGYMLYPVQAAVSSATSKMSCTSESGSVGVEICEAFKEHHNCN